MRNSRVEIVIVGIIQSVPNEERRAVLSQRHPRSSVLVLCYYCFDDTMSLFDYSFWDKFALLNLKLNYPDQLHAVYFVKIYQGKRTKNPIGLGCFY